MIGNTTKGSNFRGCLDYVLKKEGAEVIGANMMAGTTPKQLTAEFEEISRRNPAVKRPVCHVSLSLEPGLTLDDDTWNEIVDRYMERMGFTDNQYVVIRHQDTEHEHIHVVACRVRFDRSCVHDGWDFKRSEAAIRQLEREYHLPSVAPSWEKEKRGLTKGQRQQLEREERESVEPTPNTRGTIQNILDETLERSISREHFISSLEARGVTVRLALKRDGTASGISYAYEGVASAGNKLGKDYSLKSIDRRIAIVQRREAVSFAATARYLADVHGTASIDTGWRFHEGSLFLKAVRGDEVQIRSIDEPERIILAARWGDVRVFAPSPDEYQQLCKQREAVRREMELMHAHSFARIDREAELER